MATYIILSRLSAESMGDPKNFPRTADSVAKRIKQDCPNVRWADSYATFGRFDVVDIVEADDPEEVERAAMIIRGLGHATTETMLATPWDDFLETLSEKTATRVHHN